MRLTASLAGAICLVRLAVDHEAHVAVARSVRRAVEMAAAGHAATAELAATKIGAAGRSAARKGFQAAGVRGGHEEEGGEDGDEELHGVNGDSRIDSESREEREVLLAVLMDESFWRTADSLKAGFLCALLYLILSSFTIIDSSRSRFRHGQDDEDLNGICIATTS